MGSSQGNKRKYDEGTPSNQSATSPRSKFQKTSPLQKTRNASSPVRNSRLTDAQRSLQKQRALLPIYAYTSKIRRALHTDSARHRAPVLLLVGETGSGKSTQVPQYLLSETWCKRGIAITQPRRVAAINLARRVADEACTELGDLVGYSVRFDRKTSRNTKLKYLTEGSLLQEMLRDPLLGAYDCVILDEVHERSVDCDLLLGYLKRIVSSPKLRRSKNLEPLRVVIMSATANVEELYDFFEPVKAGEPTRKSIVAKAQPPSSTAVTTIAAKSNTHAADIEKTGKIYKRPANAKDALQRLLDAKLHNDSSTDAHQTVDGTGSPSPHAITNGHTHDDSKDGESVEEDIEVESDNVTSIHVQGRQFPVTIQYLTHPTADYVDTAFAKVLEIHKHEALPGDILVFLTGQDTVEALTTQLRQRVASLRPDLPKLLPLPLFAALPRQQQQDIFQKPPPNTRKVIIATNIAETSLTISGVRYVIDAGRVKAKEFRPNLNLDTLLERPISKASATQRSGRAGRESEGVCYRLYTEALFDSLPDRTTPELLRADLLPVALGLRARGIEDVATFPLLTAPPPERLKEAFARLVKIGAIQGEDGILTSMGKAMARLPVHPCHAKVILAAAADGGERKTSGPSNGDGTKKDATSDSTTTEASKQSLTLLAVDTIAALQPDEPLSLPLPASLTNADGASSDENDENKAVSAKTDLQSTLHRREGDHLTAHALLSAYAVVSPPNRRAWCAERNLSSRALRNALDVRTQLRGTAIALKLLARETVQAADAEEASGERAPPSEADGEKLARCLLAGFTGNVALLYSGNGSGAGKGAGAGTLQTPVARNDVTVHPSSVLFGKRPEAIVFSEVVFTTKAFARGVSRIAMADVEELLTQDG